MSAIEDRVPLTCYGIFCINPCIYNRILNTFYITLNINNLRMSRISYHKYLLYTIFKGSQIITMASLINIVIRPIIILRHQVFLTKKVVKLSCNSTNVNGESCKKAVKKTLIAIR